jgi:hypothetical protein
VLEWTDRSSAGYIECQTHYRSELSPEEVATLDIAIRIYFKKERAAEYNHDGSMGTVRDIFWREGADTAVDQPYGIIVEFDGYTGPTWSPVVI